MKNKELKCARCGKVLTESANPNTNIVEVRSGWYYLTVSVAKVKDLAAEIKKEPIPLCKDCLKSIAYYWCREFCWGEDTSKTNIAISPDLYEAFLAAFPEGETDEEKIRYAIENVNIKGFGNLRKNRLGFWLRRDEVRKMLDSEIVQMIKSEMDEKAR